MTEDVIRNVVRLNLPFRVVDNPVTASWNFWGLFANGVWQSREMTELDRLLPERGTMLDIGAWVGPISIWAARRNHVRVIALEPDPEAFRQLTVNIGLNGMEHIVWPINAAAAREDGEVVLNSVADEWGSSSSSMTFGTGQQITVSAMDIARTARDLLAEGPLSLVKCDIEGGESEIMPVLGPVLRDAGVPMLLAVHPGRYNPEHLFGLWAEIDKWNVTYLDDAKESMVLEPK
jgi:FkbM family methyltransferase